MSVKISQSAGVEWDGLRQPCRSHRAAEKYWEQLTWRHGCRHLSNSHLSPEQTRFVALNAPFGSIAVWNRLRQPCRQSHRQCVPLVCVGLCIGHGCRHPFFPRMSQHMCEISVMPRSLRAVEGRSGGTDCGNRAGNLATSVLALWMCDKARLPASILFATHLRSYCVSFLIIYASGRDGFRQPCR